MGPILYSVAALAAWMAGIVVYQLAMVLVGRLFGIRTREIGIGVGPTLFKLAGRSCTISVKILPLGGYTKFQGQPDADDATVSPDEPPVEGSYLAAGPVGQMLTVLSGPLSSGLLGVLCLAIPIWAGADALEVCPAEESLLRPCGVGGLRLQDQPASWQSQAALFRDTAVEFTVRLVGFQSLDGWGAMIACFITAGDLGQVSFAAWLSSVGVLLLWSCALNLLPVPTLNGFRFLEALGRAVTGKELPEGIGFKLSCTGMFLVIFFHCRALWVDVGWLWQAWVG